MSILDRMQTGILQSAAGGAVAIYLLAAFDVEAAGTSPLQRNANDHTTPQTAPYLNGYFMECYQTKTARDWRQTADTAKPDSLDEVERFSSRLACFVALSGPMDLTRVRPTELARQPLRGQDFANAFTAAFGCTAEQFEQDPSVRQRIREASPLFLMTPDDPPAFVMGVWAEDLAVLRDPPVPAVINDPHSAWHSVLLAEAMRNAAVPVVARLGPEVGKDASTDNGAIVRFLRERLSVGGQSSTR